MQVDRPDPQVYLAQALTSAQLPEELKPFYQAFERFYSHRLWFQLTTTIEAFFAIPSSAPFRIDLYESFIKDFASKLDQLKLAGIAVTVARTYSGLSPLPPVPPQARPNHLPLPARAEGTAAVAFLETFIPKFDTPETREAFVLVTMERGHFKLLLGEAEETKEAMDKCEKILDQLDSVDLVVHASFYRVSGDYWKAKAEFADYYKNSLLYLACINLDKDLSSEERTSRAHDLGISALLGTIYNFGELLMHPILDSLTGTQYEVVRNLLFAFNSGDIVRFESLIPEIASKEPFLQQHFPFLREKICLLALIEAVFKRPTQDRVLPFSVISQEAQVPIDEVEHLVMKALALKLIRGTLDQVSSTATISWVQPRVLDRSQIDGLRTRLVEWTDKVTAVGEFARSQAPELFVQ
ncbi:SPOSA6832_05144 [Sporobolomyces salmonicolor]|uniref:SPOSA6832_05144-mRNA-1:cds n=1 Tax=Sporidiobolus salmonicolor TaxID=5005 RepID=A0A0D6ET01_SPOSA|nr:SPOSA6832_05144 [Sporobolomyces salmonicolor]